MRAISAGLVLLSLTAITVAPACSIARAVGPGDDAKGTPPPKDPPATVAELRAKLKAGTFKLTEAEVVKLLGRPTRVKRPGDAGSKLRMQWEYATYIFATFKDDKLSELTGTFSENLPVEPVNLSNFERLRIGMTEPEVIEILGEGNGVAKVGAVAIRSWGKTAGLAISISAKGVAFGVGDHEYSAVAAPAGLQMQPLLPGAIKP